MARTTSVRMAYGSAVLALTALLFVGSGRAGAHPLAQGKMELVIVRDRITLWARVSLEEVVVQQSLPASDGGLVETQAEAYRAHGTYLLKHIFLTVDGKQLAGKVAGIQEPDNKTMTAGEPSNDYVVYEIVYEAAATPGSIELRQNVLLEVEYTPGNPWQSTYITGIRQGTSPGQENLLLTSTNALKHTCDWNAEPARVPGTIVATSPTAATIPPPELKQPIPDAAPDRSHFIAGVLIGASAIYLVAMLLKKRRA